MKKTLRDIMIFLFLLTVGIGTAHALCQRLFSSQRASACHACRQGENSRLYLLCTDTGERYALDLPQNVPSYLEGSVSTIFTGTKNGAASAAIMKLPGAGLETVTIKYSGADISTARLNKLFCADCAAGILQAIQKSPLKSYVLFDRTYTVFYPITERTLTIGTQLLTVTAGESSCRIEIRPDQCSSST